MTGRFLRGHCTHPSGSGMDQTEAIHQGYGSVLCGCESFTRSENSLSEGLGPGRAGHHGWARCMSYLQGSYFHFLKMSLPLSDAAKQGASVRLALEQYVSTENQVVCDKPETQETEGLWRPAYCRVTQISVCP